MPRTENRLIAFNRGIVSRLALARVDIKRVELSAETQSNWMPRTIGSMMLRPGLGYLGGIADNLPPRFLPFTFATGDNALIELTNLSARVWVDDEVISRVAVSSAVTNGTFTTDLSSWTDNDEAGSASAWVTGGYMGLTGSGTTAAIRDQTVAVSAVDANVEHALRIVVQRGPVVLRVGTSTTDDSYITETELDTGTHSLAFTPTGNFNIRFRSTLERLVLVDSCTIEAAGDMEIPTPWETDDLDLVRGGPDSTSGDIIFVACAGYQQRKIERRDARSWSVVLYQPEDGPFLTENLGPTTITSSLLFGNTTLTASAPLFRSGHVGALFSLTSNGQQVFQTATAQNTFTNAIEVTGVDAGRAFSVTLTGLSGTGSTVTLQRSLISDTGTWSDVATYTADTAVPYDDTLDNQIAWYRIGVKTGGYVAGTIVMSLIYAAGSITGVCRITAVTSTTVAEAEVLSDFGSVSATEIWAEGRWSDYRGWPTAVTFYEGRLSWEGKDFFGASASDAFLSFDQDIEGDSGAITRSIGSGSVDTINWALPLQRLVLGGDTAEHVVRSTAFDEPITPSNCNIKQSSNAGSARVQAVRIGYRGIFAQRGGSAVYETSLESNGLEFDTTDLTLLCPDVCSPQIVRLAVQTQPDIRIHCVLSDGTAGVLVNDKAEKVVCWIKVESPGADGLIEDVVVLPQITGESEDRVYYAVKRTVNGSTVRYLEKWALESECVGGTINKVADSFIEFSNTWPSVTVSGLTHLIGETVVAWYDGICPSDADGDPTTFVVSASGTITLPEQALEGVVGLAYQAQYKSAKLGQALTHLGNIDHVGLVLADTHPKAVRFGPTLESADLDYMPLMHNGEIVDEDEVYEEFDDQPLPFDGRWSTDSRICLVADAPRPATVLAAIVKGSVN